MKLKEYIAILQTYDQEVEVLKRIKTYRGKTLVSLEKRDVFPPHPHFKYDLKTGYETLVDSFVV